MYMNLNMPDDREFRRGEIYFADLNPYIGSEQGGYRPVVVLQNNIGNLHSQTIIVAPATKRIRKKPSQPTHVVLDDVEGLPETSLFMLEQIKTIDKRRVGNYVGRMTKEQMELIDAALRVSLYLDMEDSFPKDAEVP